MRRFLHASVALCEELVFWSTSEFGFIELSDAFSTGSSIMPQKKNPDFAELIRGKTGRVIGNLVSLLVTMKALPLAYNKDLQEDKYGAIDSAKTLEDCLQCAAGMIETMSIKPENMLKQAKLGHLAATDVATTWRRGVFRSVTRMKWWGIWCCCASSAVAISTICHSTTLRRQARCSRRTSSRRSIFLASWLLEPRKGERAKRL